MGLNDILNDLSEVVNDLQDYIDDEDEVVIPSKPSGPKVVQGCIRNGKLHLQFGGLHDYERGSLSVSPAEADQIYSAGHSVDAVLQTSFAGTNRKYLVGTINTDGTITIGGVLVNNPFWSPSTRPAPTPPGKEW